tara:strand:- start:103 stop:234 length:132 start_codon:yes stop_codon:yes gene_type:complete
MRVGVFTLKFEVAHPLKISKVKAMIRGHTDGILKGQIGYIAGK